MTLLILLRIALRNLREHRSKTLIIGVLISLGITILISGNSLIDTASRGIRRTFIDNYTGDLIITGESDKVVSLFGVHGNMMSEEVPTLPEYDRIVDKLQSSPDVAEIAPQITGYALINFENQEPNFTMLFGIEPESYRRMFDSISIAQGTYLRPAEEGILMSRGKIAQIEDSTGIRLAVGDPVLLSGFGAAGFRLRELPLVGIFDFTQRSELLDQLAFVDAQSLRSLLGMTVGTREEIPIGSEEVQLLEIDDLDNLFDQNMVADSSESPESSGRLFATSEPQEVASVASAPSEAEQPSLAWHFLLVKLKDPGRLGAVMNELNQWFDVQGLEAKAIDWKKASAGFGLTADLLRIIFSAAILIVAVVTVVIIMNTLVVSVVERTTEIGTMRALGAGKSFIHKMLLLETLTITVVFGVVGIILGTALIQLLGALEIEATNMLLNALFGGPVFKPRLSIGSVFMSLGVVVLIAIVSYLYPMRVALKIQPIRAIQSE